MGQFDWWFEWCCTKGIWSGGEAEVVRTISLYNNLIVLKTVFVRIFGANVWRLTCRVVVVVVTIEEFKRRLRRALRVITLQLKRSGYRASRPRYYLAANGQFWICYWILQFWELYARILWDLALEGHSRDHKALWLELCGAGKRQINSRNLHIKNSQNSVSTDDKSDTRHRRSDNSTMPCLLGPIDGTWAMFRRRSAHCNDYNTDLICALRLFVIEMSRGSWGTQ